MAGARHLGPIGRHHDASQGPRARGPSCRAMRGRVPWRRHASGDKLGSEGGAATPAAAETSPEVSASGAPPELVAAAKALAANIRRDRLQVGTNAPDANSFSIFDNVRASDRAEVMRLATKDPRASRAVGALVGMAVADSVGAPLEFLPVGKRGSKFDPKTLKVTGEFNKFSLKPGQWTDDTSMGLCLADSLLACGTYDGSDIRVRFWNWWNRGYNNAFRRDKDRHKSVGLGGNIGLSLHAIRSSGPPARFESASEDAGIGSLMRLAPVPAYFHQDIDLAVQVSAESS